jgi:transposase
MSRGVAGDEAQVAWEQVGEGGLVVAVLGYSRAMWAELVHGELSPRSLGRVLVHAVHSFGGSPRRWLFEYPDCWVVRQERDSLRWRFASPLPELARHFAAELRVWTPCERGLAEAALDYLSWAFVGRRVRGRRRDYNQALRTFVEQTAHTRPHPRVAGRSIAEMLDEERGQLLPLPAVLDVLEALLTGGAADDDGG